MRHGPDLALATIVACIALAFAFGMAARALRLPTLVGYIAAGIVIGPYTPGFVAEMGLVSAMAEVGVALLLFSVGLHFRPADLLAVWRVALPGALGQIAVATLLGTTLGMLLLDLSGVAALTLGLGLAISSTAVATRTLEDRGRLAGDAGRLALGWLVVQDLVVVVTLVLLPVLARLEAATAEALGLALGEVALELSAFLLAMGLLGRRALPWLLGRVARSGSAELFTLAVLAIALGVAWFASALFGVSFALGAFFAGVVLGESDMGHQAVAETTPLRRIFAAIFFVSVGMLLDPAGVAAQPLAGIGAILVVLIGITATSLGLLLLLRVAPRAALTVTGAIGQIGEFSFLLVEIAVMRGVLPEAARGPVLVAAIATILLTPLQIRLLEALAPRLERWPRLIAWRGERRPRITLAPDQALSGHAIVVGTGRVGALLIQALRAQGLAVVAIGDDRDAAERLGAAGVPMIWGDATRPEVFHAAGPERAALLLVALPGAVEARRVLELAHACNPGLQAVVRTHSDEEAAWLRAEQGVGLVMMGEREVALGMADYAMRRLGVEAGPADEAIGRLRSGAVG